MSIAIPTPYVLKLRAPKGQAESVLLSTAAGESVDTLDITQLWVSPTNDLDNLVLVEGRLIIQETESTSQYLVFNLCFTTYGLMQHLARLTLDVKLGVLEYVMVNPLVVIADLHLLISNTKTTTRAIN